MSLAVNDLLSLDLVEEIYFLRDGHYLSVFSFNPQFGKTKVNIGSQACERIRLQAKVQV